MFFSFFRSSPFFPKEYALWGKFCCKILCFFEIILLSLLTPHNCKWLLNKIEFYCCLFYFLFSNPTPNIKHASSRPSIQLQEKAHHPPKGHNLKWRNIRQPNRLTKKGTYTECKLSNAVLCLLNLCVMSEQRRTFRILFKINTRLNIDRLNTLSLCWQWTRCRLRIWRKSLISM